MPEDHAHNGASRRDFLGIATAAVGVAGFAAACWPFISSMNPTAETLEKAVIEVDLSGVRPGQELVVPWNGKPVFVLHRTMEQISSMQESMGGSDPQADAERVRQAQWLIVVGVCTHMGCIPVHNENGWLCPCHGSVYDNSGRILHGPAPKNLLVPPYRFISSEKIVIGES